MMLCTSPAAASVFVYFFNPWASSDVSHQGDVELVLFRNLDSLDLQPPLACTFPMENGNIARSGP